MLEVIHLFGTKPFDDPEYRETFLENLKEAFLPHIIIAYMEGRRLSFVIDLEPTPENFFTLGAMVAYSDTKTYAQFYEANKERD